MTHTRAAVLVLLAAASPWLAAARAAPAPAPAAPGATPLLERRAAVVNPSVLPGEPVLLRLAWRNASPKAVLVNEDEPVKVVVRRAGDGDLAARGLVLVRRPRPGAAPVVVEAGKEHGRKVPVLLGRRSDDERAAAEWVFPGPGRYMLSVEGAEPGRLLVTVAEPASAEDRAARDLWTRDVAACFVADPKESQRVVGAVEKILGECPTSRYAAYALWMRAENLARRGGGLRACGEAAAACETLLDRYEDFPLREEAMQALVGLYATTNDGLRARETAEELARAFPASERLALLRRTYGNTFDLLAPAPPGPPAAIPRAIVALSGAEALPDGVRRAAEAFWAAVGQGDLDALERVLARDFMGDAGPRSQYVRALWQERQGASGGSFRVAFTKAQAARVYERPPTLPLGQARTWYGPLCVVEGTLAARWMRAGGRDSAMEAPRAAWVFYGQPGGTWKLLSETALTRNRAAGSLARRLFTALPQTITAWRVSDGRAERFPYEEIKTQAGLAGRAVDERTIWRSHTIAMIGPARDEVEIQGHLRLLRKPSSPAPAEEQWVDLGVTLRFALGDGDTLILRGLTSAPAAPLPPSGPP